MEGTYLAWINLSAYLEGKDTERLLRDTARVAVDLGEWFCGEDPGIYDNYIRVNLAASPDLIRELARRLGAIAG